MNIKRINVGNLYTNCYILTKDEKCLIIDPGSDAKQIVNEIGNNKVVGILITHNHFDHVGALEQLVNKYKVSVYDKESLEEKDHNVDGFNFNVIYTPGHTDDSITFFFKDENIMFTGDFLFKESIGRTDLPTGDNKKMFKSINEIKSYDPEIKIYPGHGEDSSLKWEFNNNMFFNNENI